MALTNRQAVEALEKLEHAWEHQKRFTKTAVATLVKAVDNLNFRDYVMGQLPTEYKADGAIEFVSALLPLIDEAKRAPFYSIMSTWYYELGDKDLAFASVLQAQALDPEYSLAKLLTRVYNGGYPFEFMVSMRGELHPKVSKSIFDELEAELVLA
jgi:hypothetical protein